MNSYIHNFLGSIIMKKHQRILLFSLLHERGENRWIQLIFQLKTCFRCTHVQCQHKNLVGNDQGRRVPWCSPPKFLIFYNIMYLIPNIWLSSLNILFNSFKILFHSHQSLTLLSLFVMFSILSLFIINHSQLLV